MHEKCMTDREIQTETMIDSSSGKHTVRTRSIDLELILIYNNTYFDRQEIDRDRVHSKVETGCTGRPVKHSSTTTVIDRLLANASYLDNELLLLPGDRIGIVNGLILNLYHTGIFVSNCAEGFLGEIEDAALAAVGTAVDHFDSDGVSVATAVAFAANPVVLAAALAVFPEVGVAVAHCSHVPVSRERVSVVAVASRWDVCVVV